jgi:simple sugar transport system permease protein
VIRIERRLETPAWVGLTMPFVALVIALVIVAIVLLITGHAPGSTYESMFKASITNSGAFSATLLNATPLVFTGLCAALAFRMRIYNIGGEGQLYIGAVGAAGAALALGSQPGIVIILGAMGAGVLGGALWAAIPGFLRSHLNTNEILTSLMLNYVAGLLAYYLIFDSDSFWRDLTSPSAKVFPQGKTIANAGWWPALHIGPVTIPLGFIIGLAVGAALLLALRVTRFGFQLRVMSDSPSAGRYAGMRTKRAILVVMILSGGFAGFAGASQIGDFSHLLDPQGLQQASYGYTGIVAAALGRFNPLAVIVSAVFLGAITNAGFALQGATFPQGLVGTMEGIILFCVLSAELLSRYRVRVRRGGAPVGEPAPAEPRAEGPESPTGGGAVLESIHKP